MNALDKITYSTMGAAIPTTASIPQTYSSWSVGFDRQFDLLRQMADSFSGKGNSYPPCNIVKTGDDCYDIEVAVAGYQESDLDIEVRDQRLVIDGSRPDRGEDIEFLHKGIGERNFTLNFALAEHVVVKGAKLVNGILKISLERELPEELKPRKIAIQN